jgi:hypothetical protein
MGLSPPGRENRANGFFATKAVHRRPFDGMNCGIGQLQWKRALFAGLLSITSCFSDVYDRTEVVSAPATTRVSSIAELKSRIGSARPGDTIILTNGTYTTTSDTVITRAGTAAAPHRRHRESVGGVEINGSHGITFGDGAAFAQIRGFKFRNAAGTLTMPTGSHDCRYTRNTFELQATARTCPSRATITGRPQPVSRTRARRG